MKVWHVQLLSKTILTIGKNKKVINLIKDERGSKVMKKVVNLRPKMYSYIKANYKSTL